MDRADLLAQIGTAQADLEHLLSQLGNEAGTLLAEGQAQRQLLAQLERSLAGGNALPSAVRSEVASVIAGTVHLAQQVHGAIEQRGSRELTEAQARTRATVTDIGRDIYERRIFDPYLRFASPEEEAAYRQREESNRRAIAEALAQNTPEGDLRAARITDRQLQDAGAHGADASPEFRGLVERNRENMSRLETAIGEQPPALDNAQPEPQTENTNQPSPATPEQLASVLAAFRAAGIGGGLTALDSGHGLSVDAASPGPGQAIRT